MTERGDGFDRPVRSSDGARGREGTGEDQTLLRSSLRDRPQQPRRRTSEEHWAPPPGADPVPPSDAGSPGPSQRTGGQRPTTPGSSAFAPGGRPATPVQPQTEQTRTEQSRTEQTPTGQPRTEQPQTGQPPIAPTQAGHPPVAGADGPGQTTHLRAGQPGRANQAASPSSAAGPQQAPGSTASTVDARGAEVEQEWSDDPLAEALADHREPQVAKGHKVTTSDGTELVVPMPGRRLSDARSTAKLFRALAVTALVLALTAALLVGGFLAYLATRGLPAGGSTGTGAEAYNLSAGSAFGGDYLRQCLTRNPASDATRMASLQAMSTTEDQACRAAEGERARRVDQVTFNGVQQPVAGFSRARYLGFTVATSEGVSSYQLPVYLDDPTTGAGPRVIGAIGMMPNPGYGQPRPDNQGTELSDLELASRLKNDFLPEFFTAWSVSSDSLPQYLTADASESARSGLRGGVRGLTVNEVVVRPPASAHRGGQHFEYADGTRIEVQVVTTVAGTAQQYAYRLTAQSNGGKWFVTDIQAGLAKVTGSGSRAPTRTATPTPTQSGPAANPSGQPSQPGQPGEPTQPGQPGNPSTTNPATPR